MNPDNDATIEARAGKVDMKLEVVVVPVADVDRARGVLPEPRMEAGRHAARRGPAHAPGSGCSVQFGANRTSAAPGSAQGLWLIVSDIQAALDKLADAGIEADEVYHIGAERQGRRSGSRAPQLSLVRFVQRPRRQPLAVPGDHDPASRAHRLGRDVVRLRQ